MAKKRKLTKKEKAERRKRIKLPFPDELKAMPSHEDKPRGSDDASLHQGRKRTFEHVKGNYPTHVYIAVSIPRSSSTARFIRSTVKNLRSLSPSGVTVHDSDERGAGADSADDGPGDERAIYHVSLSRTVPVRQLEIDAMVEALSKALTQHERFSFRFNDTKVFHNDDRSRFFASLLITEPPDRDRLVGLISAVDSVFKQFRHDVFYEPGRDWLVDLILAAHSVLEQFRHDFFYENPEPHMSFAWSTSPIPDNLLRRASLAASSSSSEVKDNAEIAHGYNGDASRSDSSHLPESREHDSAPDNFPPNLERIEVDSVVAKFGNKVFTFQLK